MVATTVKLLLAASGLGFFLFVVLAGGAQLLSAEVLGLSFAIVAVLMPAVAEVVRLRSPPKFEPDRGITIKYSRVTMISWGIVAVLAGLLALYGVLNPDKMSEEAIGSTIATLPMWGLSAFLVVMALGFGAFGLWQGLLRQPVIRIDQHGIQVLRAHGSHGVSSSGAGSRAEWKDILAIEVVEVAGTDGQVVFVRCTRAAPEIVLCPHVTNLTAKAMVSLIQDARAAYT